jgi:hypothetical protein
MNYNNQGRYGRQTGFMGLPSAPALVVKGIAASIGLASESIHHHKEKKAAKAAATLSRGNSESDTLSPSSSAGLERKVTSSSTSSKHEDEYQGEHEEHDDEQWDLDDAQDDLIADRNVSKERPFERDPSKIAKHFTDDYPVVPGVELRRLSLPVVLPQRRPKARSRGFVRAYAPELQNCGIDEAMFIDFLDTFKQATLASPWLNAINLAGFAFMALPVGISQAATLALALTVSVAKNMQSRHRYSHILDQMNDDFYRPRGLYAMVLTWNPESDDMEIGINLNEMIGKNSTPPEGIVQKTKHSLRPSMGNTNGVAFTETTPLVFPALDRLAGTHNEEANTQKEKLMHAKSFASEYLDRRAQAKHAAQNPDSQLVVGPKPTFTSRYSDPNNPSNSGDLLALITAGKMSMPPRGGGFGSGYGGRAMGYNGYGPGPMGGRMDIAYGGGFDRRGMGYGYGQNPLDDRRAMAYDRRMGGFGGRGMMGYDPNYQNQPYPNQNYPNQMRGYERGMMGPGVGLGGTMLLGEGIKRILQHVSYSRFLDLLTQLLTVDPACPVSVDRQHADRGGDGTCNACCGQCSGSAVGCLRGSCA